MADGRHFEIRYIPISVFLLVTSASDLPLRTIKFCSVVFGKFGVTSALCYEKIH